MKAEDFKDREPRFIPEEFFDGRTKAWGIFEDRFGNLRRQFVVDIEGSWDGQMLTLVEDFVYDDGETERRTWRLRKIDEHAYEGDAEGVVGTAQASSYGNAFNLNYVFDLPIGDSEIRVRFNDWMFLQDDGSVMVNRASVSKWGVELGTASIFFQRLDDDTGEPADAADADIPGTSAP